MANYKAKYNKMNFYLTLFFYILVVENLFVWFFLIFGQIFIWNLYFRTSGKEIKERNRPSQEGSMGCLRNQMLFFFISLF